MILFVLVAGISTCVFADAWNYTNNPSRFSFLDGPAYVMAPGAIPGQVIGGYWNSMTQQQNPATWQGGWLLSQWTGTTSFGIPGMNMALVGGSQSDVMKKIVGVYNVEALGYGQNFAGGFMMNTAGLFPGGGQSDVMKKIVGSYNVDALGYGQNLAGGFMMNTAGLLPGGGQYNATKKIMGVYNADAGVYGSGLPVNLIMTTLMP